MQLLPLDTTMSPSTILHPTGIPSLRDYILIEQNFPLLIRHSRESAEEAWRTTSHTQLDERVDFPSVGVRILFGKLYPNIVWEDGEVLLRPGAVIPVQPEDS